MRLFAALRGGFGLEVAFAIWVFIFSALATILAGIAWG